MPDPKEKPARPQIKERTPRKRTEEIFPHLRKPPADSISEIIGIPSQPIPAQPVPTQPNPPHPVAPVRDYNKRANSLERALAEGLFPGTSQKLYNPLYQRTRGAVVPGRTVKATKRELMAWSGIRSKNTVAVNLKILTSLGWIKSTIDPGDHEGNVYEVFVYEELSRPDPTHPNPSQPDPTRKSGGDPTQKSGWDGLGKTADFKEQTKAPKTSFKTTTNTDDDQLAPLRELERELKTKPGDWRPALQHVADEVRRGAANARRVSDAAAFAAAHLEGVFARKSRPERPAARQGPASTPPEEVKPPDPETAAEYERNRAELGGGE